MNTRRILIHTHISVNKLVKVYLSYLPPAFIANAEISPQTAMPVATAVSSDLNVTVILANVTRIERSRLFHQKIRYTVLK